MPQNFFDILKNIFVQVTYWKYLATSDKLLVYRESSSKNFKQNHQYKSTHNKVRYESADSIE